jgi:hypothetical protein
MGGFWRPIGLPDMFTHKLRPDTRSPFNVRDQSADNAIYVRVSTDVAVVRG